MKLDNILNEALEDIPSTNKLYHRTNLKALSGILSSKSINGTVYEIGSGKPEISLGRKSVFSTIDNTKGSHEEKFGVSDKATCVEFEIYIDRLKTLRNIKKPQSIAELPQGLTVLMKTAFNKYMSKTISFDEVLKKLNKGYVSGRLTEKTANEYFKTMMTKFFNIDPSKTRWSFDKKSKDLTTMDSDRFFKWFFKYEWYLKFRESEERIQAKEIPLDSKYMKIKILPFYKEDFDRFDTSGLLEKIKANKDLFITDKNYDNLIKDLYNKETK